MNITLPVDTAVIVPINAVPLIDDTDFKTIEDALTFDQAGLDLVWNFLTSAGVLSQTAVTPTEAAGDYDWQNKGNGMYGIEIPASGGASINNDTEGFGWFSGYATGVLPWRGPTISFVPANVVNSLVAGSDYLAIDVTQWKNATAPAMTGDAYAYLGTNLGANGANATETGGTGDQFTAVPWNAAWDAEVQSECTDALNAYDPPTNAEMEARTVLAASYATAANQTNIEGKVDIVDGIVDAILVDTGTTLPGTLSTIAGYLDTEIAAILEDTGTTIPGLIAALNNLSAAQVNAEVLDVIATDTLVDGKTIQAALRYIAAVLAGKCTNALSGTETFTGLDGVTARVAVTGDANGNRSSITYDP